MAKFEIKGQLFDCNFASSAFAKKVQVAALTFSKKQEEAEKQAGRPYAEIVQTGHDICAEFIDTVFGEGKSKELFPEGDWLEMEDTLADFLLFMKDETQNIIKRRADILKKYKAVTK